MTQLNQPHITCVYFFNFLFRPSNIIQNHITNLFNCNELSTVRIVNFIVQYHLNGLLSFNIELFDCREKYIRIIFKLNIYFFKIKNLKFHRIKLIY